MFFRLKKANIIFSKSLKNFCCYVKLVQAMKQVPITTQLLRHFRENPQTLIFEGYCVNFDDVTIYNDGDSYALTAVNHLGVIECCIYTEQTAFIDEVVGILRGNVKFCGVSTFITDYLKERYDFEWLTHCDLYVWNGKPLNLSVIDCEIRPLELQYAKQVSDGTPYHADLDDVRMCLTRHPSAAVYIDNKAVCWCLLHLEGDLGMLYTVPEYRRQGYALKVMTALTQMVLDSDNVPYAYIIEDNVASKNLALKYNLDSVCKADYFEINLNS